MKTHTQLLKRFFTALPFSILVLVFPNSPPFANERFALVCDWEMSHLINGMPRLGTGSGNFTFIENEKKLELIDLSGIECSKVTNYQATESEILIECDRTLDKTIMRHT